MRADLAPEIARLAAAWPSDGMPATSEATLIRAKGGLEPERRCACHGGQAVDAAVDEPLYDLRGSTMSPLERRQRQIAAVTVAAEASAEEVAS